MKPFWVRKLLSDLNKEHDDVISIYYDNKSAIAIAKILVQHRRNKHIIVKYHAIREAKKGDVRFVHCNFERQLVHILTKSLPKTIFETLRSELNVFSKNAKE